MEMFLEEKIYFKPADYGKGVKKKEKVESMKEENPKTFRVICLLFFLAVIIITIIWLLHGETTTTGQYPENERSEYLECTANNIIYEKVAEVDSDKKELKISMNFSDADNNFTSASLKYTLLYDTESEAYSAEALSHAQFNIGLVSLGYESGKFNNKFTLMGNKLMITLGLTSSKDITDATKEYLLIDEITEGILPSSLNEYRSNYEAQGFNCKSSI